MKFSGTFDAALKDPNSAGFRTKAKEIENTVLSALNDDNIGGVKVTNFEAGIVVSFLLDSFFLFITTTSKIMLKHELSIKG